MVRLTERFSNGQAAVLGCGDNCKYDYKYCKTYNENCPTLVEIYEKLAAYEDAEEQGLLLRLPCRVGDKGYSIRRYFECKYNYDCKETVPFKCGDECFCEHEYPVYRVIELEFDLIMLHNIGKSFFLTKSEAEEALRKMKEAQVYEHYGN